MPTTEERDYLAARVEADAVGGGDLDVIENERAAAVKEGRRHLGVGLAAVAQDDVLQDAGACRHVDQLPVALRRDAG